MCERGVSLSLLWTFCEDHHPVCAPGYPGKERREKELKSEHGLEILNQTKICVSKQGSTGVSLCPCFVSWRVTYRCVSVGPLTNMQDFCASREFGIKEQCLHLGSVRVTLRGSPFYICRYLSTTSPGEILYVRVANAEAILSPP